MTSKSGTFLMADLGGTNTHSTHIASGGLE